MESVTDLLEATRHGDQAASNALFTLIYDDLRALARRHVGASAPARLQTTSLVNEACLRLVGASALPFRDRRHLFAVAARAMRQIAVDHARTALTQKRGGGIKPLELQEQLAGAQLPEDSDQVVALDEALDRLAEFNPRMAQIVELRFFGGLDLEDIEPLLGVGTRTLKRDWRVARAFLYDILNDERA